MNKEYNKFPIFYLILAYLISIAVILFLSILLLGYIEICLIICFGLINSIFICKFLKINLIQSLLIGFLISSFSLIIVYVFWYLKINQNPIVGLLIFSITSISVLYFLKWKEWNFKSINGILTLLIFTFLTVLVGFNLNNYYPQGKMNKKLMTFKILDSTSNPIVGENIKIINERQPLFNMREFHKVADLTTDLNGKFEISLSQNEKYHIRFLNGTDINIKQDDLKSKNLIEIKFE